MTRSTARVWTSGEATPLWAWRPKMASHDWRWMFFLDNKTKQESLSGDTHDESLGGRVTLEGLHLHEVCLFPSGVSLSAFLTRGCSELQSATSLGQSLKLHKHGGHSSEETQSRATPLLQHWLRPPLFLLLMKGTMSLSEGLVVTLTNRNRLTPIRNPVCWLVRPAGPRNNTARYNTQRLVVVTTETQSTLIIRFLLRSVCVLTLVVTGEWNHFVTVAGFTAKHVREVLLSSACFWLDS